MQQYLSSPADAYIHSVLLSFTPALAILLLTTLFPSSLGLLAFASVNLLAYAALSSLVDLKIYWRSCLLTNTFVLGFLLANQAVYPALVCAGYYLMCLSFFHLSEFVATALFNSSEVSTDSFLINHSWEYGVAMLVSWLEFGLEALLLPQMKTSLYVRFVGLALVMFGETFRKLAMYTCGKSGSD